jgi:excisionase family DNA binding protein
VERIAELHEALAAAHRNLAQELENQLAAGRAQSDLMDVPEAQSSPAKKLVRSLVSVDELARRLGVSASTVRRWRRDGKLPEAVVLGGVVRWRPETIEEWLEEQDR